MRPAESVGRCVPPVTRLPLSTAPPRRHWVPGRLHRSQRACRPHAAVPRSSAPSAWGPPAPTAASPGCSSPPSPAAPVHFLQEKKVNTLRVTDAVFFFYQFVEFFESDAADEVTNVLEEPRKKKMFGNAFKIK